MIHDYGLNTLRAQKKRLPSFYHEGVQLIMCINMMNVFTYRVDGCFGHVKLSLLRLLHTRVMLLYYPRPPPRPLDACGVVDTSAREDGIPLEYLVVQARLRNMLSCAGKSSLA